MAKAKLISFDDFLDNPNMPSVEELKIKFSEKFAVPLDQVPDYGAQYNYSMYYDAVHNQ